MTHKTALPQLNIYEASMIAGEDLVVVAHSMTQALACLADHGHQEPLNIRFRRVVDVMATPAPSDLPKRHIDP